MTDETNINLEPGEDKLVYLANFAKSSISNYLTIVIQSGMGLRTMPLPLYEVIYKELKYALDLVGARIDEIKGDGL